MNINDKIKALRLEKSISQTEMAEKLNISQSAYFQIEKGNTELTVNKLIQITKVFGISINEILGNEKEMDIEEANYLKEQNADLINENKYLRNLTLERKESIIEKYKPYLQILNNIFIQTAFNSAKELGIFNENDTFDFDKHYNFIENLTLENQKKLYVKICEIPNMFHAIIDTDVSKALRNIAINSNNSSRIYPFQIP